MNLACGKKTCSEISTDHCQSKDIRTQTIFPRMHILYVFRLTTCTCIDQRLAVGHDVDRRGGKVFERVVES